jgi:hypothetical protein
VAGSSGGQKERRVKPKQVIEIERMNYEIQKKVSTDHYALKEASREISLPYYTIMDLTSMLLLVKRE